jgi:hypothetical protein
VGSKNWKSCLQGDVNCHERPRTEVIRTFGFACGHEEVLAPSPSSRDQPEAFPCNSCRRSNKPSIHASRGESMLTLRPFL